MESISKANSQRDVNIAVILTDLKQIEKRLCEIEENHLPHIEERLNKLEKRIAYFAGAIAVLSFAGQLIIRAATG